ncbi:hypothetical protein KY290_027390 [Solanum tuberosum]|uniref:Uncharacterized protein n=1 Tax=Solanum tuberosum TaxID=4113 RepID=A0ABQ7UEZ1_SOLTU|nr:hypothetical protein KY290_027390 [Solanum tuberosum]
MKIPFIKLYGEVHVAGTQASGDNVTNHLTTLIPLDGDNYIDPLDTGSDDLHEEHVESTCLDNGYETQVASSRSTIGSDKQVACACPDSGGLSNPTFSMTIPQGKHLEVDLSRRNLIENQKYKDTTL